MRLLAFTTGLLLYCALQLIADPVVFTPAVPTIVTINFGALSLPDEQLPAFTFIFDFNYSQALSNYGTGFTFLMDNSENNPNTGLPFSTAPITLVSTPTLTATSGSKTSWLFDAHDSFVTVTSTGVEIGVAYDPPNFSILYDLIPLPPWPDVPTVVPTNTSNNNNQKGQAGTTTVGTKVGPEPASLCMMAAGLAILLRKVHRKRRS